MKDSRKGKTDGEKELSTPNPHVDGGKGEKAIVYNTNEGKKEGGEEKGRKRKRENRKNCVLSNHNTSACPMILFVLI